jgi:hypothetical protein
LSFGRIVLRLRLQTKGYFKRHFSALAAPVISIAHNVLYARL